MPVSDARRLIKDVRAHLGRIPDASTLQRIRAEREDGEMTPYEILERIATVVSRHVGLAEVGSRPSAAGRRGAGEPRRNGHVPPRIAATLVATAYACAVANGCDHSTV